MEWFLILTGKIMTKTYLTQAGYDKLQADLDHLRTVRRQEVAARLHEAMADGDAGIDNDAEVDAAKNEQAFVEGRIRELEMILSNARIIDETRVLDTVEVGAKVEIQEDSTPPEKYTIVGAAEADPTNGYVSNESPLGKALMGHKAGETVTVKAPNGEFTVTILKVK
jgi:transcription elongation factor GreA